jgi:hypothetical protein
MLYFGRQGYRVIAHDRRGHGRSDKTWDGNDMDTYSDDFGQLFEKLDLKDAIMVGHSTGARPRSWTQATAEKKRIHVIRRRSGEVRFVDSGRAQVLNNNRRTPKTGDSQRIATLDVFWVLGNG